MNWSSWYVPHAHQWMKSRQLDWAMSPFSQALLYINTVKCSRVNANPHAEM